MIALIILFVLLGVFVYIVWRQSHSIAEPLFGCTVLQTIPLGDGVRVEIVGTECAEGLPHTTDARTIRMTAADWKGPRRDHILKHEYVHLSQKSAAKGWEDFYKNEWGYKCLRSPPPDVPRELVAALRPNPDTSVAPWALWRDRWLFFPTFVEDDRSLRGAKVRVWDRAARRLLDAPPDDWRNLFCDRSGCPHQYEHPHEIAAEWIAGGSDAPAARKLFEWRK